MSVSALRDGWEGIVKILDLRRVAAEFDKTPKVNIIERGVNRLLDRSG
jgi:hypothetical protein